MQPSSGAGAGPTSFTFTGSSANGYQYLDSVQILFNWAQDGTDACYILYSRTSNVIYLMNDRSTNLGNQRGSRNPGNTQ